ncbi:RelA/SpoT domain-containing protein [Hyphomicrobium sp. NDB2Meth4]|uniref:RelA/SpoT domain-containing protein n=1 Tax=Hyphomicrobium sp. NDB2Meth4 TaxID=1892846 RepID=UPI000930BB4C|nr:RelA/SpoT domain-containing protein [Hyphomicrobium sp. NDB2Meth4]
MTFDEYVQGGKELYTDLAEAVAAILEAAIKAHPHIRRLQVQRRAKAPDSLAAKIGSGESGAIEEKAKDLAGVRVVLYSNSDVDRLSHSRILFDNFEVVWERTKLHYPRGSEGSSQYIGDNYVVRLKESRTILPEYSRFAGLVCEVQVQTILNHAWSETAHDTIYKSPKLKGVGAAQLRKIEERMKRIQETYLLPAGYEFQQALNDFERIASGQRLVASDILAAIRDAPDNNLRVERLEEYESLVLPIVDDVPSVASDIRRTMVDAVKRSLVAPIKPIETPIGTLPGRGIGDVVDGVLSILKTLSYVEPDKSYQTLSEIFVLVDEGARTKVVQAVGQLAQHSLRVWQEYGPAVQEILLDAIAATPPDRLASTRPLMIEVAGRCLAPEVTGTSNTSTTFTWQTGAVAVSDRLNQVRDRAFSLLTELMQSSQSDLERRQIFTALQNSTHLPHQGQYADDLMRRAFADTVALIRFLSTTFEEFGDPLKETIEQSVFFLFRRCRDMPADLLKDPSLAAARDEVMAAAREFRDRVNLLGDYVAFKALVGFETVFPYEWEESERASTDFEAKTAHRQERIDELLTTVTATTADEWFKRINEYAAIESEDLATFPHLGAFVASVAKAHPKIGSAWLDRSQDKPIAQFIPGLLRGLYTSDPAAAIRWVDEATKQNDNLSSSLHSSAMPTPPYQSGLQKWHAAQSRPKTIPRPSPC